MEDWQEEDKSKELQIPANALPGLRDLKVQFVALIYFDRFLGPVVYIAELSRGSSYISKLRDYSTLSEVYAGVARSDIDTQSTLEDTIAVFRYYSDDDEDTPFVLLISHLPNADLEPIREIGRKALFRSKGDPEIIGEQLSKAIREYQSSYITFQSVQSDKEVKILEENRVQQIPDLDTIVGYMLYDLESHLADFRFLPNQFNKKTLDSEDLLRYFDYQLASIEEQSLTSILYHSTPLLATKVEKHKMYLLILVTMSDIFEIPKIEKWVHTYAKILAKEWKFSNHTELNIAINVLNNGIKRNTLPEFITRYLEISLRCQRIFPSLIDTEMITVKPPDYISSEDFEILSNFDGEQSVYDIYQNNQIEFMDLLILIEWGIARKLVGLLQQ